MEALARVALVLTIACFLMLPETLVLGRHITESTYLAKGDGHRHKIQGNLEQADARMKRLKHEKPDTLQIAGSKLPDCSHACGSCSPCRLVMVSYVCASIQEAETCPMAYKCMCNNKAFPVP